MGTAEELEGLDPVVEFYKRGVDRTLIRENLRRSPEDRLRALQERQRIAAKDLEVVAELEAIREERDR
ncbi:MAG: hypothetical protein M3P06_04165 [Acidobacteriota bacterium]|nr:hypothetical protein [Acidobacteriota bacterium]